MNEHGVCLGTAADTCPDPFCAITRDVPLCDALSTVIDAETGLPAFDCILPANHDSIWHLMSDGRRWGKTSRRYIEDLLGLGDAS